MVWKTPLQVDVDHPLPILEREVAETLEPVQARGVDQHGDRTQPVPDGRQRGIHLRPVCHVGGESQIGIRRLEVDDGDIKTVGAQAIRHRRADTGPATGDHRGLHDHNIQASTENVTVSTTKNLPRNYENLTLTPERLATLP